MTTVAGRSVVPNGQGIAALDVELDGTFLLHEYGHNSAALHVMISKEAGLCGRVALRGDEVFEDPR
jgi:hypothetical protein